MGNVIGIEDPEGVTVGLLIDEEDGDGSATPFPSLLALLVGVARVRSAGEGCLVDFVDLD